MADKDKPIRQKSVAPTTPEDYSTTSSGSGLPGADYSYTVELVGTIQLQLGKLIEAVESLKGQVKDHGAEIKAISTDIHTAKITLAIAGAIITALLAFAGWAINKGVDVYVSSHQQPAAHLQQK
jgi:hypothetical protein